MAPKDEEKTTRRDQLLEIQSEIQKLWEDHKVFQANAATTPPEPGEKFFGNFPYPYMNGMLHLGHAFTITKLEFAAAFHRLCGRNVLLPFAFHCTGMPIKATAFKLAQELKQYGNPPVFPPNVTEVSNAAVATTTAENTVHKSKKSKAAAKSEGKKWQWEIMKSSYGLSDEEIVKFCETSQWLSFFPPLAVEDLKKFGLGCDWRRSFVTTDTNPFYDSFVRWQMRKLRENGRVVKDFGYTVYSPLDGQPCADHDRAVGEGVKPQGYLLIKMEVLPPFGPKMKALEGRNVFLAAATMSPETMYGQTNCWVLPDCVYGAFEINGNDVFVVTNRAALNLAYQKLSRVPEKPSCLLELSGYDLIGLALKSPLAPTDIIYSLPLSTVSKDKGTGIASCVPGDSQDDFLALQDLKLKAELQAKFGVKDEWILPPQKPCVGEEITENSRGFSDGTVLLVGEFTGRKIREARPLISSFLLGSNQAVKYSEPESKVVSRTGDECIVALTEQWFITYGEADWQEKVYECLRDMNVYSEEARHGFEHTISWLEKWACSRSFGLGTRIPWDEQFLVESLSDSTLYMAYYTVAHILQNGDMYGSDSSVVKASQMTDEVWDYVFTGGPFPETEIPNSVLLRMKQEFEYWYPFDLRVSGKELMHNHLAFCLYTHTALMPKHRWPRGFRCNGHLMLNSQKMSKSTGNFRSLREAIQEYSADATRFSLADSGDGLDDANFVSETANSAIKNLIKELAWIQKFSADESSLRSGPVRTYADTVFENEINIAVRSTERNYMDCKFKDALKTGFYDLQAARNEYRSSCGPWRMHGELLRRFTDVQTRLIAPICPHYAEHVWRNVLKHDGFVINAGWPSLSAPNLSLKNANHYLQKCIVQMKALLKKQISRFEDCERPTSCVIYVNEKYSEWEVECIRILELKFSLGDDEIVEALRECWSAKDLSEDFDGFLKKCMPFVNMKRKDMLGGNVEVFSEIEVLRENCEVIKRQLGVVHVEVVDAADDVSVVTRNSPSPGNPVFVFLNL